ncbi:MAG: tRNA (guanine(10)-N2)-dimethyltransferase [Methanocella sp. PtaU1.Bin125]|nr:MAG: tRNA (guanine(10)-N2)-dimethyltransferase [Methanocella sp. PtaU1.Bin125]
MRALVFELSGEHGTLPKSEIIGCIEAYGRPCTISAEYDQTLIVETDADPELLARRLALTHNILELVFVCAADPAVILEKAAVTDLGMGEGQSFVVRVSRVKTYGDISSEFEKKLGAAIWRRGYPVSLTKPDVTYRAIVTEGVCVFGRLICPVDRAAFDERAPLKKPFFLPGVLMPRMSRAVVNMTRIREGWMLDPFSGTGGTLVEAGLISRDIHVVGCDIQEKMVRGTRKNLRFYGANYDVVRQDSLRMGIKDNSVDAVVTDFPYGQSTPIAAAAGEDFYHGALAGIFRVLKPGRYAVVVSKAPMEKLLIDVGFTVIESHRQRIHRSLTRHITVIRKSQD